MINAPRNYFAAQNFKGMFSSNMQDLTVLVIDLPEEDYFASSPFDYLDLN